MKIKVSDLKDFLKKSNKIKSKGVIPIHDYLLIDFEKDSLSITKNNGNMFCKHTVEEDNESREKILIEEKRLTALVNNARGEFIHFSKTGKKIILNDDVNEVKLEQMKEVDINNFQTFPGSEGAQRILLNPEVLAAIFEAKGFCSALEATALSYVYAHKNVNGNFSVFATNAHILYLKTFEEEVPELVLSGEVCSIISTLQHVEYFSAGNYDFFDTGKTVYGFIKADMHKLPDYMSIIRQIEDGVNFTTNKNELLSFCELINSLAVKELPIIKFDEVENDLLAQYGEEEYNATTEKKIVVKKNFSPKPVAFNNGYLTQVLKCFATEDIVFSAAQNERFYSLTNPEEKGLTIIIMPVMYK